RSSQRERENFIEHTPVGIRWTGPDGTILRANQAELAMLGYRSEEYVGRNVAAFHVDPEAAADTLRRLRAGEPLANVETLLRRRDGSICYGLVTASARFEGAEFVHARCLTRDITERKLAELAVAPILDPQGKVIGATSITHDITERKHVEQQLLHAALHDALTDLPNRAYFVERVSQAQARVRRDPNYRFAVLFIDSDNFKAV